DVVWNEGTLTLFGYAKNRVASDICWWQENVHPDDRERVLLSRKDATLGSHPTWSDEYRYRCANGLYALVMDRGYVICDETGRPVRMVGAMTDITEKRRAAEALAESARRAQLGDALGTAMTSPGT